jgi:hypothetical protein
MKVPHRLSWVLALGLLGASCNSNPTNSSIAPTDIIESAYPINTPVFDSIFEIYPGPYPTPIVPTPTITPTPTATPFTSESSLETLNAYPFRPGNFWSYSATYYGYKIESKGTRRVAVPIFSAFIITDVVTATEVYEPFVVASIARTATWISGESPETSFSWYEVANPAAKDFSGYDSDWSIASPHLKDYFYVIGDKRIYYQEKSNGLNFLDNSSVLIFASPLSAYPPCWFSRDEEGDCKYHLSIGAWTGFDYVAREPISQTTPAGFFSNCRTIAQFSRGGGINKHVCYKVGLVGVDWEYHGQTPELFQPLGFRLILTNFSTAQK